MNQELAQKINIWLDGWKGLAQYFHRSERTLRRWHREFPIPWEKRGPLKRDSVRIHVLVADAYFETLRSVLVKKNNVS